MQAFLQRIVNGGGRIEREYGLGKLRIDLLIIWPYGNQVQKVVIELKVLHKSRVCNKPVFIWIGAGPWKGIW